MATLTPVTRLFGDGIDECPECGHLWIDGSEGHYAECRYRLYEEGLTHEGNEKASDINLVRRHPRSIFSSAA